MPARAHAPRSARSILAAGRVLRVGDAPPRVTALPGEVELLRGLLVELDPEGEEPADPVRALPDGHLDRLALAQASARDERVLHVEVERVVVREHGGDAPLRVLGRPLRALALREDEDRTVIRSLQRERETGDATTEHEEVHLLPGEGRHGIDL